MRSTKCYPAVFLGHSLGEVVVLGEMSGDVGLPEPLQVVQSLGQPVGAGDVHDLDRRMVAVEAVHVTLLLAGERGRGGGWRLRWRRHDKAGADLGCDCARAGAPRAEVTIQVPAEKQIFSETLNISSAAPSPVVLLSLLLCVDCNNNSVIFACNQTPIRLGSLGPASSRDILVMTFSESPGRHNITLLVHYTAMLPHCRQDILLSCCIIPGQTQ